MRRISAGVAIASLVGVIVAPTPALTFSLHIGPFHIGVPLPFRSHRRHRYAHHHYPFHAAALHHYPIHTGTLPENGGVAENQPPSGFSSALYYPAIALPDLFDDIFWPDPSGPWPFSYESIFRTAFANPLPDQGPHPCQQADRSAELVQRISEQTKPNAAQSQILQRLGGALGMAAAYLTKSCPSEIPPQSVARLQLMQSQVQVLSMALDIIRQPLQQFEQSLDRNQQARFAPHAATSAVAGCITTPAVIDWPIDQIDQSVQPSDTQHQTLSGLKRTLQSAAIDLNAHCPAAIPPSPLSRLAAAEARLDSVWRALLSIQVALANFESKLSDQQRTQFEAIDLAAAR
ncbi:MAG TPA: Spy/CpxP family protein refolding chaperone [Xanthobacteraceae bacterium]|jgi:hypothetical protein